tara:strand:- start:567 stop:728 length:162 start_codon:yes stop_codon:yes gene_type:complete
MKVKLGDIKDLLEGAVEENSWEGVSEALSLLYIYIDNNGDSSLFGDYDEEDQW